MVAKSIGSPFLSARAAVATLGPGHETGSLSVSSFVTKVTVVAFLILSAAVFFISAAKIDPDAQLAGREFGLPNMAIPP